MMPRVYELEGKKVGVTNYISMDSMLRGEMTSAIMRNYGADALGSVVETVLNGVEENTYQYKPYGSLLAKTGVATDPSFLWNGGSGFKYSRTDFLEFYVKTGNYSAFSCRWNSPLRIYAYWSQYAFPHPISTSKAYGEIGDPTNPYGYCHPSKPKKTPGSQNPKPAVDSKGLLALIYYSQYYSCDVTYLPPPSQPPTSLVQWIIGGYEIDGGDPPDFWPAPALDGGISGLTWMCGAIRELSGAVRTNPWKVSSNPDGSETWRTQGIDAPGYHDFDQLKYKNDCSPIEPYLRSKSVTSTQAKNPWVLIWLFKTCCVCNPSACINIPGSGGPSACITWTLKVNVDATGNSVWTVS